MGIVMVIYEKYNFEVILVCVRLEGSNKGKEFHEDKRAQGVRK
jgi:hypothetical protein